MSAERKYVFGPVPSRRLGLSLGVDVVPFKVCSLDCIYCQLGDKHITSNAENVLSVLKRRPCTLEDICSGLNICRNEALKYVEQFERQGLIDSENRGGVICFFSASQRLIDKE